MDSSLTVFFYVTAIFSALASASSDTDSLVYTGCSQFRYSPGSAYESNINSLFTSLVNSANSAPYKNFTITGSSPQDTVYGLYQCRGDLSPSSCFSCVSRAISQLGSFCVRSTGGGLQLQGCFVKYDNTTFLGVEDKTVLFKRCGSVLGYNTDLLARRDAVLGYIGADDGTDKPYRFSSSGGIQAEAQCVQDLDQSECQDCMATAIGELKTDCGSSKWGKMYLAKCYARFWEGGEPSGAGHGSKQGYFPKTAMIIVVILVAAAVVTIFLALCQAIASGRSKGMK